MSFGPQTSSTVDTDNPITQLASVTQSLVDIETAIQDVAEAIEATDTYDASQSVLTSQVTTLQAQAANLVEALTAFEATVMAMGATPTPVTPATPTITPGTDATPVVSG
jgi:hypothetical protein